MQILQKPLSFTLSNYQSFDEEGATLSDLRRINLILGPNNTGKSKILRAIDLLISGNRVGFLSKSKGVFQIKVTRTIRESEMKSIFKPNYHGGGIPGSDHWRDFGSLIHDATVTFECNRPDHFSAISTTAKRDFPINNIPHYNSFEKAVLSYNNWEPTLGEASYFIAAERDIRPEPAIMGSTNIEPNGAGITNAIREIITSSSKNSDLVEKHLLNDLNEIIGREMTFTRITAQTIDEENWEIFLHSEEHGIVPLSECGSGLKTILILLCVTNITVKSESNSISEGLFLFEELENSLHPRIQTNLYKYIDTKFGEGATVFISSHSSVCIDYFQGREDVSIHNVFLESGHTRARVVTAFSDRMGLLDTLGVKASTALQTNFVVWVEGPTDRVYLKKWIGIVSKNSLKEGVDYSIMFYGGSLLYHLSVQEDEPIEELIRLLKINRNSAIVIDSDRSKKRGRIRDTKKRIKSEAENVDVLVWVTQGREIENYVNADFYKKHFNVNSSDVGPYSKIWETLEGKIPRNERRKLSAKMDLCKFVDREASANDFGLDWQRKVRELCDSIVKANE